MAAWDASVNFHLIKMKLNKEGENFKSYYRDLLLSEGKFTEKQKEKLSKMKFEHEKQAAV